MTRRSKKIAVSLFVLMLSALALYASDDAKIKLLDAAGVSKFAVQDSGGVSVMTVDTNGKITSGAASAETGGITLYNAASANGTTLQAGNAAAAVTYTLPVADASSSGQFLTSDAAGALGWTNILSEIHGGTNQSAYATGDILYASAPNTLSKLAAGTEGQALEVSSTGTPQWKTRTKRIALLKDAVGATITNAPAGGREITNQASRAIADLTNFTNCRVQFIQSLASTGVGVRVEYSTDQATWLTLIPDTAADGTANNLTVSTWNAIPAGARGDVFLRAMVYGNGTLDPVIRTVVISAK